MDLSRMYDPTVFVAAFSKWHFIWIDTSESKNPANQMPMHRHEIPEAIYAPPGEPSVHPHRRIKILKSFSPQKLCAFCNDEPERNGLQGGDFIHRYAINVEYIRKKPVNNAREGRQNGTRRANFL